MTFSADTHRKSIASRFSAAAGTYQERCDMQRKVARELGGLLPAAFPGSRILDIGAGTGAFTEILAARFPAARIDAIDLSEAMMRNAPACLRDSPKVRWITADLLEYRPGVKYGMVSASSSLHWIYPLTEAFNAIGRLLVPGGTLVCSIMLRGTLRELRSARLAVAPHKTAAAQLPMKSETLAAAAQGGFSIEKSFERRYTAFFPDASALLKSFNEQGVTGGCFSGGAGRLTRAELDALAREYEIRHREKSGLPASYRVLFLRAGPRLCHV